MTVHALSSSSPLTFMFHLVSLLFLRAHNINILFCCLFKWRSLSSEFWTRCMGLGFLSDSVWEAYFVCTQKSVKVVLSALYKKMYPYLNNITATLIFHLLTDVHGSAHSSGVKGQNKPVYIFFFSPMLCDR